MKQPTYKIERIKLADCFPHADAEAYSASSDDRKALANSVKESGVLSPIAVVKATDAEGWLVIDGIGRMEAMKTAGIEETDAQVFDLGDLTVPEFVVCKNAMMRKVTTGTRVMAYLKCHEREVLAAADPEKYARRKDSKWRNKVAAVSHETAGDEKGWNAKEIAERIGVSKNDVLAGIELLKATAEAGDEEAKARGEGEGEQRRDKNSAVRLGTSPSPSFSQLDLFETAEAVLRGETPIRRWKAAAGGKVSKVGGKAAADYAGIAWRTVKSWRGVWENWQTVPMEARVNILSEFRDALAVIPDDFRTMFELVFCEKCKVLAKSKKR